MLEIKSDFMEHMHEELEPKPEPAAPQAKKGLSTKQKKIIALLLFFWAAVLVIAAYLIYASPRSTYCVSANGTHITCPSVIQNSSYVPASNVLENITGENYNGSTSTTTLNATSTIQQVLNTTNPTNSLAGNFIAYNLNGTLICTGTGCP